MLRRHGYDGEPPPALFDALQATIVGQEDISAAGSRVGISEEADGMRSLMRTFGLHL
jgi:hypothetical protein